MKYCQQQNVFSLVAIETIDCGLKCKCMMAWEAEKQP